MPKELARGTYNRLETITGATDPVSDVLFGNSLQSKRRRQHQANPAVRDLLGNTLFLLGVNVGRECRVFGTPGTFHIFHSPRPLLFGAVTALVVFSPCLF